MPKPTQAFKMEENVDESISYYEYPENYTVPRNFTTDDVLKIIPLTIIFVISLIGNVTILVTLFRNRQQRKSRVNLLIMHLCIADLFVTLIIIPTEVIYTCTIVWHGGMYGCKILKYLSNVALYSNSFIVIVISFDRYAAIITPLSVQKADKRCRIMLQIAWILSFIFSLPNYFIFEKEVLIIDESYMRCASKRFAFNHPQWVLVHHFSALVLSYIIPLLIIVSCYVGIVVKIYKKTFQSNPHPNGKKTYVTLRRSGTNNIPKARVKAVKLTAAIVIAYIINWTPYFVATTIVTLQGKLTMSWLFQQTLFAFAVLNTCMDPLIYGLFSIRFSREFRRCCWCMSGRDGRLKINGTQNTMPTAMTTRGMSGGSEMLQIGETSQTTRTEED
ncbi:gonadotropin-releasing hormone receptor-like [Anneissia japonica]|uniref:gonadotropin-releasing hormone receptor-like n=1 Tax=Anneissia japonica TaxID=1529436 RepID=UPI0014259D56|nr:gonadotropin-releasing hormone receptor-like [Anneissia japonica]